MWKFILAVIALVVVLPQHAKSQTFENSLKGLTTIRHIRVIDDVSDGCLSRPNELKKPWELELLRSKIKIRDVSQAPRITIYTLGYASKMGRRETGCHVFIEASLKICGYFKYPWKSGRTIGCDTVWSRAGLLATGTKQEMQAELENITAKYAREFALDYEKDQLAK